MFSTQTTQAISPATCTVTSVSSNVIEKVLLKIKIHESRTRGQPDRNVQPGWMQVTYSWCAQILSISSMSRLPNAA